MSFLLLFAFVINNLNVSKMYLFFLFLALLKFETFCCYVTQCEPVVSNDSPLTKIPDFGTFRGSVTISLKKRRPIYQFLGIPYAVPPMGMLRFKAPISFSRLNTDTIYNSTHFKFRCPQFVNEEDYKYLQKYEEKLEDCLYLNVFTVSKEGENQKPLLPVLVYIHGGGYYQGSAVEHCPNYLLDHDMILVTLQYRLGPLGFLNLETDDAPGNMGLLDTLEAIEWVHKYIKYFGGDNQRITISGQSSGAVSVTLLLVSPLTRPGLFQQAIIQSGNLFGDWVMDYHSKEHALEFLNYLNCTDVDISNLLDCARKISIVNFTQANNKYMYDRIKKTKNCVREIGISHAIVQKNVAKIFLFENPEESMKNGRYLKLPILTGVTKDEGSMFITELVDHIINPTRAQLSLTHSNESSYLKNEFFHDFLKFIGITDDIERMELLKDFYLPDEVCSDFNHTVPSIVDLAGAAVLKSVVLKFARYMREHAPTYLYTFNFKGRKTKLGYGKPLKHLYLNGVAHSDELLYLFPGRDPFLTKEEQRTVERLTSLWAGFVTNGRKLVALDDMPPWPPMNTSVGPYLYIGEKLKVKENFLREYQNYHIQGRIRNSTYRVTIAETLLPITLLIVFLVL